MKRLLLPALLLTLLTAACAPLAAPTDIANTAAPATPSPIPPTATPVPATPAPSVTPAPTGGPIHADVTPAQRAALNALMDALHLTADQVSLVNTEAVDWPDGSLGFRKMGVMYIRGPIPGFRIIVAANGQHYEYHTNQDGSVIAPEAPMPASDGAAQAAAAALQAALGLTDKDVVVAERAAVEWPDSCLGLAQPGKVCAQMVTPGWIITLTANGLDYEYHTNADGSVVRPASPTLTWKRTGGIAGFCDTLTVSITGEVQAADCKGNKTADGQLTPAELQQLQAWAARYQAAQPLTISDGGAAADAMTVTMTLNGQGDEVLTSASQRPVSEMGQWAQALYNRLKP